jgi:outer membrane protein OmpA-like peptidoglycan-associated protein
MKTAYSRVVWTIGLMSVSVAVLAAEPKPAPPQEPAGFITGGVIGGFAAGPVGAVIGAGIGTWLGNRVHRAGEAAKAEAQVAALQKDELQLRTDKSQLQTENASLLTEKGDLSETNRALTARLDQLSHSVEAAQSAKDEVAQGEAAKVLDGLQGDVLFRTGSAEIAPEMANGIHVLAAAVAKSPALKVRVDGYADPRGTADTNLKLSEARANAVRDLFLAAGVGDEALEINAYGKSQSVAADSDGYALERRVRLTLQAQGQAAVAQSGGSGLPKEGSPRVPGSGESLQVSENE